MASILVESPPCIIPANCPREHVPQAWQPLDVDVSSSTPESMARALKRAGETSGILTLSNLPPNCTCPLDSVRDLLDAVRADPSVQTRVNDAYAKTGSHKLVWKDSFAHGKGGNNVDQKRVIDLAAHRMDAIKTDCPSVVEELGEPLANSLGFFQSVETELVPRIMTALGTASGNACIAEEAKDFLTAYRMVDYYARPSQSAPPRCGEHRDFGTLTLIFQDGVGGLEVQLDGVWNPLPPSAVVLLFGWCTHIRSNARIKAAMHRVKDPVCNDTIVPRRTAAILFVAPNMSASVAPTVLLNEEAQFVDFKTAGDLKPIMQDKWEMREGTIPEDKIKAELEEQRLFKTQDDIVKHVFER